MRLVSACTAPLGDHGRWVQLLPASDFAGIDGRPRDRNLPAWRINGDIASRLVRQVAQRSTPLVIDYEHQTRAADLNGQPAPAAGWFRRVEWREGEGLFAEVDWTARAKAMIGAREYLYISPVFEYDKNTGEVLEIIHAALTNTPNIDGMREVALRAAARFAAKTTEEIMHEDVLAALGLEAGTDEAAIIAAAKRLQADAARMKEQLGVANTAIATLRAQSPDPARWVPIAVVEEIKTEVAALRAAALDREIGEIVTAALSDGRVLPAQESWARDLGRNDLAALKKYVETAKPIAALRNMQMGDRGAGASAVQQDPEALVVAANQYQTEQRLAGRIVDDVTAVLHVGGLQ